MTIQQSFFRLKLDINCLSGGIQENYDLNPPSLLLASCIPIALGLMQYRGQILASGSSIVNAVISKEDFNSNYADGFRFPASSLFGPILMKKINNSTSETVIEGYADPSQGISWQLDTGVGIIDHRMIRMIRATWAAGNAFTGIGVLPGPANVPPFTISTGIVTLPVAIGKYMDAVRDNCASVKRTAAGWQVTPYARSANSNWKILGITKRAVGFAWPRIAGRQQAWA